MNNNIFDAVKDMSPDERKSYFETNKEDLSDDGLREMVGMTRSNGENPNSDAPYNNNYYSSPGFVCDGERRC